MFGQNYGGYESKNFEICAGLMTSDCKSRELLRRHEFHSAIVKQQ